MKFVGKELRVCAGVEVGHGHIDVCCWVFGGSGAMCVGSVRLLFDTRQPIPWERLLFELSRPVCVDGVTCMPVSAAAIDSGGHFSHEVCRFVMQHQNAGLPRLLAVKGFANGVVSKETMHARLVDVNEGGVVHPQSFTVYFVDVAAMQAELSSCFPSHLLDAPQLDMAVYALAARHWLSAYTGA